MSSVLLITCSVNIFFFVGIEARIFEGPFDRTTCLKCMISSGLFPGVCILYSDVSEHCLFHLHRQIVVERLSLRNVGVFIREKDWLENSLSQ